MTWFYRQESGRIKSEQAVSPLRADGPPMTSGFVVCGMATRPTRQTTAKKVVRQILPQVDSLHLHLDGFHEVPTWAGHPKITASVHPNGSAIGAAGKLDAYHYASEEDVILMIDDDVRVPKTLVSFLERSIRTSSAPALYGFHGSVLRPPINSYLKNREVVHLEAELTQSRRVDVVATCVAAFLKKDLTPGVDNWIVRNAVDLQLSIDAQMQGVGRFLLPRKRNWLSFQDSFQPDSIYRQLVQEDSKQTNLARELVALRPPGQH
jgi:hypothetical protein